MLGPRGAVSSAKQSLSRIILNDRHLGVLVSIDLPQPAEVYCNQQQQEQPCGDGEAYAAAPVKRLGSMTRLCHAENVASQWSRPKDV